MTQEQAPLDQRPARQWGRTRHTRRTILDAAKDVFLEVGYNQASIAHIVERSGVSVGSVYHHFNGKADLFIALWEEFEAVYSKAARSAVAEARGRGVEDPLELFLTGARAYLEVARHNPGGALLFREGDGPPGLDVLSQQLGGEWIRSNLTLLGLSDEPVNRLQVRVLTRAVVEGERAVAALDDPAEIDAVIEKTLEIVRRVAG